MALRSPPPDFLDGLRARPVVVIAGAGVTAATVPTAPIASWTGLLKQFLESQVAQGSDQQFAFEQTQSTLRNPTAERLVRAAAELRNAWGQDVFYAWIGGQFDALNDMEHRPDLIRAIGELDCPILTTNFDTLIEKTLIRQAQVLQTTERGLGIIEHNYTDVLHIHGCHLWPSGLVIDSAGYERILEDGIAQALLTNLASRTLLFVGCGSTVDDPNIGSLYKLLTRLSQFDSSVRHFRLVRELDGRPEVGVFTNIVYGTAFDDLEPFLQEIRDAVRRSTATAAAASSASATVPAAATPADLRMQIAGTTVRLECATTALDTEYTCKPDWARTTSIRRLEATLYAPSVPETPAEQLVDTAQLLGNHLLMSYGTMLASALQALQALPDDQPCRLVLDIQDDDTRRRPWECLYSSNQIPDEPPSGFIARSLALSIVRASTARRQLPFPPRENKPLKVLLAIADPHDSLKAGDLHGSFKELGTNVVSVQPPDVDQGMVTIATIRQALETWSASDLRPVDILHIVAQARSGDRGPSIELDNDEALDLDKLGPLLEAHPPRLVVLQLQPPDGSGSSVVLDVGYTASTSGVPNLLAVHHNAGHASTTDHLKEMYGALREGQRLDRALQIARAKYFGPRFTESVCFPALFVALGTEELFAFEPEREPADNASKQESGQAPVPPDGRTDGTRPNDPVPRAPQPPGKIGFVDDTRRTVRPETSKPPIESTRFGYTTPPVAGHPQVDGVVGADE